MPLCVFMRCCFSDEASRSAVGHLPELIRIVRVRSEVAKEVLGGVSDELLMRRRLGKKYFGTRFWLQVLNTSWVVGVVRVNGCEATNELFAHDGARASDKNGIYAWQISLVKQIAPAVKHVWASNSLAAIEVMTREHKDYERLQRASLRDA